MKQYQLEGKYSLESTDPRESEIRARSEIFYRAMLCMRGTQHVYFAKNVAYLPFLILGSVFRDCRLLWGYHFHFVDSILL